MARESHPGVLSHHRPQSRQTERGREGGEQEGEGESSMKNEPSDGQKTMMKRRFSSPEVILDHFRPKYGQQSNDTFRNIILF